MKVKVYMTNGKYIILDKFYDNIKDYVNKLYGIDENNGFAKFISNWENNDGSTYSIPSNQICYIIGDE